MTVCGAVGALIIDGREVAALRCERPAGHDTSVGPLDNAWAIRFAERRIANGVPLVATPHAFTFEWRDAIEAPDMDLLDPDEELVSVPMPDDEP